MSIATALKLATTTSGRSSTLGSAAAAAGTLVGVAGVASIGVGLVKKLIPGRKEADEYSDSMHRMGNETGYASSQSEKLAGSLNSVGSKLVELKNKVKDNAAALLTWGAIGALTAKAIIGLSEGADRAVESYYSMGEAFGRTNKGMLRAFKDSWNITLMEEWVEMSAARMNMPAEAVKGLYEKLTRSTRTFYSVSGKIRYDILNDTMKQVVAFSRITGASVDQAADLYARFTNQFGKTHKQALSGMQTIARAGQLVNEELHDMGKDGGVALEDLVGVINDAASAFDGFSMNVEHLAARSAHAVKIGQELGMTYNQAMDASKQMTAIFAKPGGFIGFQAGEALRQQVEEVTKGLDDAESRAQALSQKFGVNIAVGRTLDVAAQGPNAQMNTMDILKGTKAGMETQFVMMQELAKDNRMSLDVMKAFLGGENLSAEQAGDLMQVVTKQGSTFSDFARRLDRSKKEASAQSVIEGSVFTPTMVKEWLKSASPALQIKAAAILGTIKVTSLVMMIAGAIPFILGLLRVAKSFPSFLNKLSGGKIADSWGGIGSSMKDGVVGGFSAVKTFAENAIRHVRSGGVWDTIQRGISEIPVLFSKLVSMFQTGTARATVRVADARSWAAQTTAGAREAVAPQVARARAAVRERYTQARAFATEQVDRASERARSARQRLNEVAAGAMGGYGPFVQGTTVPGAPAPGAPSTGQTQAHAARRQARLRALVDAAESRVTRAQAGLAEVGARRAEEMRRIARSGAERAASLAREAGNALTERAGSTFRAVRNFGARRSSRQLSQLSAGTATPESVMHETLAAQQSAQAVGPAASTSGMLAAGAALPGVVGGAAAPAGGARSRGARVGARARAARRSVRSGLDRINRAADSSGLTRNLDRLADAEANRTVGGAVRNGAMRGFFNSEGSLASRIGGGLRSGAWAGAKNLGGKAMTAALAAGTVYSMYEMLVPHQIEDKGVGGTEDNPMAGTRKNSEKIENRQKELDTLSAQIDLAKGEHDDAAASAWQSEYDSKKADLDRLTKETDDFDSLDRHNTEITEQVKNLESLRDRSSGKTKQLYNQKIKRLKDEIAENEKKFNAKGLESSAHKEKSGLWAKISMGASLGATAVSAVFGAVRGMIAASRVAVGISRARGIASSVIGGIAKVAGKIPGVGSILQGASKMVGKVTGSALGRAARFIPGIGTMLSGAIAGFSTEGTTGRKLTAAGGAMAGGALGAATGAAIGSAFGGVGAIPGAVIGGLLGMAGSQVGQRGALALWDNFADNNDTQKSADATPMIRPYDEPKGAMAGSYEDQVQRGYGQGMYANRQIEATGSASSVSSSGEAQLVLKITNMQDLMASGALRLKQDATGNSGGR